MKKSLRSFILFMVLFGSWLLMSGHYSPLLVGLGVGSCALAAFMAHRIDASDKEGLPFHVMARLPAYLLWLLKEIVMSNIATGRIILAGGFRPVMFRTPATQQTAAGLVTYANSITLTPGTVTIEVEDSGKGGSHEFLVHALAPEFREDVESGEMDRRCSHLEITSTPGGGS